MPFVLYNIKYSQRPRLPHWASTPPPSPKPITQFNEHLVNTRSVRLDLLPNLHTNQKKRKYPVTGNSKVTMPCWCHSKATTTQIGKRYAEEHPDAEDHTKYHSCQLRTEHLDFNSQGLTKVGQQKNGKAFLLLRSNGSVRIIHSSACRWWCNSVGDILLAYFGLFSTIRASFTLHSPPEYFCWPCPSLYDYGAG